MCAIVMQSVHMLFQNETISISLQTTIYIIPLGASILFFLCGVARHFKISFSANKQQCKCCAMDINFQILVQLFGVFLAVSPPHEFPIRNKNALENVNKLSSINSNNKHTKTKKKKKKKETKNHRLMKNFKVTHCQSNKISFIHVSIKHGLFFHFNDICYFAAD